MHRHFCAFFACLVLVPVPVRAAGRLELVVSGSRSASVVVTFSRAVTLYGGDPDAGESGPVIKGDASLAGYLLADATGSRVLAGVVRTTHVDPRGEPSRWSIGATSVRLPAGRYVLTLIASAQTELRVPVDGLAGNTTYRPSRPVPVAVRDTELSPEIGTESSGRAAIRLTARTVTVLGVAFTATATKGSGKLCIAPKGRACPGVAGSAFAFQAGGVPVLVEDESAFTHLVLPDVSRTGNFDVVWSVTVDGLCTKARGVAITIG